MHDGPLFRRLTLPALLVSLALMLSAVERLFSLDLLLPVPGFGWACPTLSRCLPCGRCRQKRRC